MIKAILAISSALLIFGCATSPRPAKAPLVDALVQLTGPAATDCGSYEHPRPPDIAWHCAVREDSQGQPFRLAFHPQGIDSGIWRAVGRAENGRAFVMTHDSNPGGGSEWRPKLSVTHCDYGVDWSAANRDLISCREPMIGSPLFPQLMPPSPGTDEVYLTGGMTGVLVIDHDCVRLRTAGGTYTTVLWHRGIALEHDSNGYLIRHANTGKASRIGETLRLGGGGECPSAMFRRSIPRSRNAAGRPMHRVGCLIDRQPFIERTLAKPRAPDQIARGKSTRTDVDACTIARDGPESMPGKCANPYAISTNISPSANVTVGILCVQPSRLPFA